MSASSRVDRVEVFSHSATGANKGRSSDTYTRVSSGAADHAYWARKEPANAREVPAGLQSQHLVDWVFLFGIEAAAAITADGALRHGPDVFTIAGFFPVRLTNEIKVFAVSASDQIRTLVNS